MRRGSVTQSVSNPRLFVCPISIKVMGLRDVQPINGGRVMT